MVSDNQGIFIVQKLTSQNGGVACRLVLRVTFRLRKVVHKRTLSKGLNKLTLWSLRLTASNFSFQFHSWIDHEGLKSKGNDHQLKKLLIVKEILLYSSSGNIKRTVWRIHILMLGCKELKWRVQSGIQHTSKACSKQFGSLTPPSSSSSEISINVAIKYRESIPLLYISTKVSFRPGYLLRPVGARTLKDKKINHQLYFKERLFCLSSFFLDNLVLWTELINKCKLAT